MNDMRARWHCENDPAQISKHIGDGQHGARGAGEEARKSDQPMRDVPRAERRWASSKVEERLSAMEKKPCSGSHLQRALQTLHQP